MLLRDVDFLQLFAVLWRCGSSLRVPSRDNDNNATYNKTSADILMREERWNTGAR